MSTELRIIRPHWITLATTWGWLGLFVLAPYWWLLLLRQNGVKIEFSLGWLVIIIFVVLVLALGLVATILWARSSAYISDQQIVVMRKAGRTSMAWAVNRASIDKAAITYPSIWARLFSIGELRLSAGKEAITLRGIFKPARLLAQISQKVPPNMPITPVPIVSAPIATSEPTITPEPTLVEASGFTVSQAIVSEPPASTAQSMPEPRASIVYEDPIELTEGQAAYL